MSARLLPVDLSGSAPTNKKGAPDKRPSYTTWNINRPANFIIISVEISTTKFVHALSGALLGAGGGIVAHNFVVALAALIVRGAS